MSGWLRVLYNWRAGASLPSRPNGAIFLYIIGERERANLVVQLARFFGIFMSSLVKR